MQLTALNLYFVLNNQALMPIMPFTQPCMLTHPSRNSPDVLFMHGICLEVTLDDSCSNELILKIL